MLPWFVNGTLEGHDLAFVQGHLAECERCRIEVDWLRELHKACVAAGVTAQGGCSSRLLERICARARAKTTNWAGLRAWVLGVPAGARIVLIAQLAVVIALGALLAVGGEGPAVYRTLGAVGTAPATPAAAHVVAVFDASASQGQVRDLLRSVGARIVDGPTAGGGYVLELPSEDRTQALHALRGSRAVLFAEPLSPADALR